jgi:hypothetical protein
MSIYTWNLEHGNDRWPMLASLPNAHAICLQETAAHIGGLAPGVVNGCPAFQGAYQIGSNRRGTAYTLLLAWFGATGMNSVGVMVAGGAGGTDIIPPPAAGTRGTPGLQHAPSGVWIYSIHAPSNGGSAWQMGWINAVIVAIAGRGHANWICAGDFNATPAAVAAVSPVGTMVVHPNCPTQQSGGCLDFAVCSAGVLNSAQVGAGRNSDHWPVKFD